MKKFIAIALAFMMLTTTVYAYNFPEPDWGALLNERKSMETATDFELYVEGNAESAPYYGAKLEPRSGTYIGMIYEYSDAFKPMGSYLTYMEVGDKQTELYYPNMMSDNSVVMLGWNTSSIDNIDYDYIRSALENLNKYNKPMLIRFANEMNCSNLGDEPEKYIQAFRNVANMVHEYPNFAVVWSPNDMGSLDRPFEYFYPGNEYVDWVGVSCYMTRYFSNEQNTSEVNTQYFMTGDYAWATNKIKPFMEFLKKNNINKPVMLSECGVARYNSFGDDYTGWHEPRLRNLLWNLIMKYPQIKMINYFNNPFHNFGEHYAISDYSESVKIFNEAANNGAYLQSANDKPEFVFSPANNGETLVAKNGTVKLYTLAYFDKQPDITVTYKIDGTWYHEAKQIPYTCALNLNGISDGKHTFTIISGGTSKDYDMYKSGQCIAFGRQPKVPEKEITVTLNGSKISFDQPPVIVESRTLVPIRAIFEAMGYNVSWDQASQTATASNGGNKIVVKLGEKIINYTLNSKEGKYTCDVPAQMISDRILVPVRAVSEIAGCKVDWDGNNRQVIIVK